MPKIHFAAIIIGLAASLLLPVIASGQNAIRTFQKTILLDPGHGGGDPGITLAGGINEKDTTLALARRTADILDKRYTVILTRTDDRHKTVFQRADAANRNKGDLFISIHLHTRAAAAGYLYIFHPPGGSGSPLSAPQNTQTWESVWEKHAQASKTAAARFKKTFKRHLPRRSFTIVQGPVISIKGVAMPAVLIEPFSMVLLSENPETRNHIIDQYALLIAESIDLYFSTPERK